MMIFFNKFNGITAVPDSRILEIWQHENIISISYDIKEYTWLDEEKYVPKPTVIDVHLESEENAVNKLKEFYTACKSGKTTFFIG